MNTILNPRGILCLCVSSILGFLLILSVNTSSKSNIEPAASSSILGKLENNPEIHNVLLLSSWAEHLPWSQGLFRGVEQALAAQSSGSVNLFTEYLDYSRLGPSVNSDEIAAFLRKKYQKANLDAVIVDADPALSLIFQYGQEMFGDVPYVLLPASTQIDASTLSTQAIITIGPVVQNTVSLAVQQNPGIEEIVLIADDTSDSQMLLQESLQAIETEAPNLQVVIKADFTVEELAQELSRLPRQSVVIFTLVFQDRIGQVWRPVDVLEKLVDSSSVPIYVFYDSLIGTGAVGGYVQNAQQVGSTAIQAVQDLVRKQRQEQGKTIYLEYDASNTVLDWRSLKRWNIPQSLVPGNAEIRYRKPFIWETYLVETILALIVIVVQACSVLAISVLFLQRRQLSQRLLVLNQQLEQRVAERTRMLHQMAIRDDLTGIDNRKEFYRKAKVEFARFKRYQHPFTLALLDLDKFKMINDTYGHLAGDSVLKFFAQEIAKFTRENDIWGRIGGEEFALILSNTPLSNGISVLEKIRQHIQDISFVLPDDQVIDVTASIGAVESDGLAQKIEDLVHNADQQLYHAKANGRNRVVFQEREID